MRFVLFIEIHLHANSSSSEFRVATINEISLFSGISALQPKVAIFANTVVMSFFVFSSPYLNLYSITLLYRWLSICEYCKNYEN